MKKLLLVLSLSCVSLLAQGRGDPRWYTIGRGSSIPGSCSPGQVWIDSGTPNVRYCFVNTFAAIGGGISSLNTLSGATQTFTNDTNVTIVSGGTAHVITWAGTLAAGRLNSNVVQGITNDTNVTGSISAQNLTLGWTGTLAASRMANAGVFTGDVTTTFPAVTVSKINGTSVPTNSAADQFLGTTASATAAWAAIPSCLDAGGNHLNYN